MNRILTAIALFAIVGSALAFQMKGDQEIFQCKDQICQLLPDLYTVPGDDITLPEATTNPNAENRDCATFCPNSLAVDEQPAGL